jgi:outer membrane protein TolC
MNNRMIILLLISGSYSCVSHAQQRDLEYFLQQGKANNPLQNDYQNQVRALGLDSQRLGAAYGPQVAATGNVMYAPVARGWGYDPAITNGQNIGALMVVSKEIIGKNNLQTRLHDFTLQQKAIGNQSKLSEQTLAQSITQQYILCYGDQQQLALSAEIYSLLQNEDAVLKKLTQAAVFKQTEYLTFKVALQQQELAREQVRAQLGSDLAALNYICGIEDSALPRIAPPDISQAEVTPFAQSIYADRFETDSLKNANDGKIINLNYKPRVSVFADGGYLSALPQDAYKNLGMSVGLSFSLPVYDGKQRKAALLQRKMAEDSRKKYLGFYKHQYNQQIMQLQQQLRQYQHLMETARQQLLYAGTLVDANKRQLNTGDVRMTDYLLSVSNFLNLRASLIQSDVMRLSLINQLNYLILK